MKKRRVKYSLIKKKISRIKNSNSKVLSIPMIKKTKDSQKRKKLMMKSENRNLFKFNNVEIKYSIRSKD